MRTDVDVHDLPARLDEVIALENTGQEIVLTEHGTAKAKLVPIAARRTPVMDLHPGAFVIGPEFDEPFPPQEFPTQDQPRPIGLRAGAIVLPPDFNDPLPDEFWVGEG